LLTSPGRRHLPLVHQGAGLCSSRGTGARPSLLRRSDSNQPGMPKLLARKHGETLPTFGGVGVSGRPAQFFGIRYIVCNESCRSLANLESEESADSPKSRQLGSSCLVLPCDSELIQYKLFCSIDLRINMLHVTEPEAGVCSCQIDLHESSWVVQNQTVGKF